MLVMIVLRYYVLEDVVVKDLVYKEYVSVREDGLERLVLHRCARMIVQEEVFVHQEVVFVRSDFQVKIVVKLFLSRPARLRVLSRVPKNVLLVLKQRSSKSMMSVIESVRKVVL